MLWYTEKVQGAEVLGLQNNSNHQMTSVKHRLQLNKAFILITSLSASFCIHIVAGYQQHSGTLCPTLNSNIAYNNQAKINVQFQEATLGGSVVIPLTVHKLGATPITRDNSLNAGRPHT